LSEQVQGDSGAVDLEMLGEVFDGRPAQVPGHQLRYLLVRQSPDDFHVRSVPQAARIAGIV
jgi:hypothetical protein